ncbi:MAG: 4-(cytidine 5'-diphospho)-2-C-methyl-D-erythritol kinase [Acidobacteria bacterium]|nr:4-(cytidine 5'-diphospho)-2-C-methyl-D-erythritol kinase [Acidobacteriota bacterium]
MRPDGFTLPSFAKINLHLKVTGKRPDGYHELCTVFQAVSLCDEIEFRPADSLELGCNDPNIPTDENNLIIQAGKLLQDVYKVDRGAKVHLLKNIPFPGGLGGGSSNAATAMLGFCRLWGLKCSIEELSGLSAEIGADVPFFFHGGTALGTGTGTDIEVMSDAELENIVIVTPPVDISTAVAYKELDAPSLTKKEAEHNLIVCRKWVESACFQDGPVINDFEAAIFTMFPEVAEVKSKLLELGAVTAGLSGSGASVFGIFDNRETRQTAMKALGEISNWRSFAVAAVSRKEYRERLGIS